MDQVPLRLRVIACNSKLSFLSPLVSSIPPPRIGSNHGTTPPRQSLTYAPMIAHQRDYSAKPPSRYRVYPCQLADSSRTRDDDLSVLQHRLPPSALGQAPFRCIRRYRNSPVGGQPHTLSIRLADESPRAVSVNRVTSVASLSRSLSPAVYHDARSTRTNDSVVDWSHRPTAS